MKLILNFIGAFVFYGFAFIGLAMFAGSIWRAVMIDPMIGAGAGYWIGYVGGSFVVMVAMIAIGRLLRLAIAGQRASATVAHNRRSTDLDFGSYGGTD